MNRSLSLLAAVVMLLIPALARATTTVEVVGRITASNCNSGPWAGARVGEYVYLTYDLIDPGTVITPGQDTSYNFAGFNPAQGNQANPLFRMTVRGQTLNLRMTTAINPTTDVTNNYPVADVHLIRAAGDAVLMVAPGTVTPSLYNMIFELHDSHGVAWSSTDITQIFGTYGPGTFDTVDWSLTAPNGTSFSVSLVKLMVHSSGQATGSCCLGDGWCAQTTQAACSGAASGWSQGADCAAAACAPAGACCKGNGSCELLTQTACGAITSAVYEGDNTACLAGICPPTAGCCTGTACQTLTQQACRDIGGRWLSSGANCSIQPQHSSPALNANLPDATGTTTVVPGVYTNSITLSDPTLVQSVEVWLSISEPRINDYYIRLTGPNGTTLDLVRRIGSASPCNSFPIGPGYAVNDTIVFQDSAAQSFYAYVLSQPTNTVVSGGRFKASGCTGTAVSLDAPSPAGFGGIPIAGTWTLEIRDERTGVAGFLQAWALSFNGGNLPPCQQPCIRADVDGNGVIEPADVAAFVSTWFTSLQTGTLAGDYDGNGAVEPADIAAFVNTWFTALNTGC